MTPRFAAPAVRGEGEGRIALGNRISVLTVAASLWRRQSKALEISLRQSGVIA
jgi:hypothetical protein